MDDEPQPDCTRCRHFYVTWDAAHPRGCRAYSFKTTEVPAKVVLRESGEPCRMFEPKRGPGRAEPLS